MVREKACSPLGLGCRVLFTVVALLAAYLTIQSFTGTLGGGCGTDYSNVLGSKWAKIFVVPVGALGLATYLIVLVASRSEISLQATVSMLDHK